MGKYDRFIPEHLKFVKELREHDWFHHDPLPVFKRNPPLFLMDAMSESQYERKLRMLRPLSLTCQACTMCELGRNVAVRNDTERDPHVFSNMNPTRFAVIGQNPGWNELKAGEPFVGDAGANFNKEIETNGLSRDDFYIGNGVKCFTPNNAKPSVKHQERCKPFLEMELSLIKPLLVVVLGASAFEALCPGAKFGDSLKKITKSEAFGVNVFAVYHPSPRNMNSPGRANMFRDQIKVLCKLVNKLKQKHNL